jgi:hypothetical protein
MKLTEQVVKNIICKLLKGDDYRVEIVALINADFLQFAIGFFKKIVNAKLNNQKIDASWYKKSFILDKHLAKEDIAINSGLNMKTINNMFNSTKKEIVIDASKNHYESLYKSIKELIKAEDELDLNLTIKLKGVSVELNIGESLIVINTLAVKRAALRGSLWSTVGKRVEKPLMQTLCKLYKVPEENFRSVISGNTSKKIFEREVDFYLLCGANEYKCEIKLMGRGSPESADVVITRNSKVFIADKLSDTNKSQLESIGIEWVELRSSKGFRRFKTVLENLKIPHSKYVDEYIERDLASVLSNVFS